MNRFASAVRKHTAFVFLLLCALLFISVILCVGIGPVPIGFRDVWRVMLHRLFGLADIGAVPENTRSIVWYLRAPRVLLGVMAGAALSLSGVAMQAFTKNPLADPYVLGISSGASFGAVLTMSTGVFAAMGPCRVQLGAFAGALAAITLVCVLSAGGGGSSPVRLVLVGVAVSAMFSAFTSYAVYRAPDDSKVREATFWMLGGVAGVKWEELLPLAVFLPPAAVILFCLADPLNAMMMGDSTAVTLGVSVGALRRVLIVLTALLTGAAVSVAGCIGFVGLVIPHIVRSVTGADHRRVVPLSMLLGGIFLVWVDVAARMLDVPKEIPVGILTSMLGAPFFLWMIRAGKYAFREKS